MSFSNELDGPVGVGGWMYLFLFGFVVGSPLMLVFGTYSNLYSDPPIGEYFGDYWLAYQIFEWSLVVMCLAANAYVVWRLYKVQNSATVWLTIAAILVLSFGLLLVDAVGTSVAADVELSLLLSDMTPDFTRATFYCMIWCSYFAVSKRVKNTYHRIAPDDVQDVFE